MLTRPRSSYIQKLSIKKRDKALIGAQRYENIRDSLLDPGDTTIETAQFRYVADAFLPSSTR
jgi:hypothetical protein